jgi:peptidoglycan/LPS O-acetylase OafA/YrhL
MAENNPAPVNTGNTASAFASAEPEPVPVTQKASKPRVFFPNLDGLRFVCFFMVFLFHINKSVTENYAASQKEIPGFFKIFSLLFQNGNLGVNFFFVLSGFLITFLLIKEKEYTGKIHVGNFYVRRMLRIWPLFYLCVFIGFVVFPGVAHLVGMGTEEHARPLYYLLFINNFDVIETGHPNSLILGILWSIAIEEQFYLSWPLLLSFLPLRFFKYACLVILGGSLVFRLIYHDQPDVLYFNTFAVIGDMALGGLFAYLTSYPNKFLDYITHLSRIKIIAIYVIAAGLFLLRRKLFYSGFPYSAVPERLIIAVFFALIIVEQNFSKRSFYKFSHFKLMTRLGIYTYGLYCLHFIGIYAALAIVRQAGGNEFSLLTNLVQALLALFITIGLSLLSYHLFEKKFLTLKDRFAFITK